MFLKYTFDSNAFKKIWLKYLFIMMIPSFIVDVVLLYRITMLHPTVVTEAGTVDIFGMMMLFIINFVFLKSYALLIYFLIKYIRRRSYLITYPDKVVFHKRRLVMSDISCNEAYFTDYFIKDIEKIVVRKSGKIELRGVFPAIYLCQDEKTEHHKNTHKMIMIPSYYLSMQQLKDKLYTLYAYKDSSI